MMYLMLSLILILPTQTAAFTATVTGERGITDMRGIQDITEVHVEAESQTSIVSNFGELFEMTCEDNNGTYLCEHLFPLNGLDPGTHTLSFTQTNGAPPSLQHVFYVDGAAPQIVNQDFTLTSQGLLIDYSLKDTLIGGDSSICSGITSIAITTESQTIFEQTINDSPCELTDSILIPLTGLSGEFTFFLTITDALSQSTTISLGSFKVDYVSPTFQEIGVWMGNKSITQIASHPVVAPYVTVTVQVKEDNLSMMIADLSEFTADPLLSNSYENLLGSCLPVPGFSTCYFFGIHLAPINPTVTIPVRAIDGQGNVGTDNLSVTFDVVEERGEVVYFDPLEKHCDSETSDCYVKKGVNKFRIGIIEGGASIIPSFITLRTSMVSHVSTVKPISCENNESS